ncbi:MAG: hypothetical protein H6767_08835 [Candidatus Peribacteria bacterium]|nr:MAG: hypothetical protein H6767_08835 [Candidatus Peribacteria bacterium]
MRKHKNILTKVMAILALVGILIGVVGTGILFFMGSNSSSSTQTLTPEELNQLIQSFTGETEEVSVPDMSRETGKIQ